MHRTLAVVLLAISLLGQVSARGSFSSLISSHLQPLSSSSPSFIFSPSSQVIPTSHDLSPRVLSTVGPAFFSSPNSQTLVAQCEPVRRRPPFSFLACFPSSPSLTPPFSSSSKTAPRHLHHFWTSQESHSLDRREQRESPSSFLELD